MANTYFSLSDVLGSGVGQAWQPKSSAIRVGRDVSPISMTTCEASPTNRKVLTSGDTIAFTSRQVFNHAKTLAMSGRKVDHFRAVKEDQLGDMDAGDKFFATRGDYAFALSGESLEIHKKNEDGEWVIQEKVALKGDMRIAWDEAGEPTIHSGRGAYTDGVLQAKGDNEILIRTRGVNVKAAEGTTVLNLSDKAGTFSGGNNVTYMGAYSGGTFEHAEGSVNFAGYFSGVSFGGMNGNVMFSGVFEDVDASLANGLGTFSGYFSRSSIELGNQTNTMSGLFLDQTSIQGGDAGDRYDGRFVHSVIEAGKGDDVFGGVGALNNKQERDVDVGNRTKSYLAVDSDFVETTINAGGGNDDFKSVMTGGALNLETGANTVTGIFADAEVNGGEGDDAITAIYARGSAISTGLGNDTVNVVTGLNNSLVTDEGENSLTMGVNDPGEKEYTWQSEAEFFMQYRPLETGELQKNTVDAETGQNTVTVSNGHSLKVMENNAFTAAERERMALAAALLNAEGSEEEADETAIGSGVAGTPENDARRSALASARYGKYAAGMAAEVNLGKAGTERISGIERTNTWEEGLGSSEIVTKVRRSGLDGTSSYKFWEVKK